MININQKHGKKHVKIGDKIKVISGSQKGKIGNILSLDVKKKRLNIDSVLPRQKFVKEKTDKSSQKIDLPIYIHFSNVMLWDKEANNCSKTGYKLLNNEKTRYFKKSGNIL